MTPEEKKKVRKEIESRIAKGESMLSTLRKQTAPVPPTCSQGEETRRDAIVQKQMAEINIQSTEVELNKLALTLAQIDEKDFGICALCGKKIPLGRILIVPEARICVTCASKKR